MENRNIPDDQNWDQLLIQLETEKQEGMPLTAQQEELLLELRQIKGTAAEALKIYYSFDASKSLDKVKARLESTETYSLPSRKQNLKLWLAAAAAVLFLVTGLGLFFYQPKQSATLSAENYKHNILPGKNTATLTLGNGKTIVLADVADGELSKESGISIMKTEDGTLVYQVNKVKGHKHSINTLSTAKGETYRVELPDHSKIWLNSASSIKYPADMSDLKKRTVELEGEAYFEVFKDKTRPFIVKSKGQYVEVLGTHFNINSYDDEPTINTTLLEGAVKINDHKVLKPGQQSNLFPSGNIEISDANPDAVSWKDGKFRFNNADIKVVLRQLARWYDVEIRYVGEIPDRKFSGGIDRNLSAAEALDLLKFTKVNFKIQGKTIIVNK